MDWYMKAIQGWEAHNGFANDGSSLWSWKFRLCEKAATRAL